MYKTKLLIACILSICICYNGYAQKIKPDFRSLIYVSYHPIKGPSKQTSLLIAHIIKIDSVGNVTEINNSTDGVQYYKIETDTTFRMPDTLLIKLNTLCNPNRRLSSYRKYTKDLEGGGFAGPLNFLSYTNKKGITDKAVIVNGLFEAEFQKTLNNLWDLQHPRLRHYGQLYINKALEKEILKCQQVATYIPDIVQPPTEKYLQSKSN